MTENQLTPQQKVEYFAAQLEEVRKAIVLFQHFEKLVTQWLEKNKALVQKQQA